MALNFRLCGGTRLLVRHLSLETSKKKRLTPFGRIAGAIRMCIPDTSRLEDPQRQEFKELYDESWHCHGQKQNRHKECEWMRQSHHLS